MNRLTKFLMAFAALGLVACTTDATDDQAVTLPDSWGGDLVKHTLDVSLDIDTKLALGDKTAEGKYPVKWTEGDILGVNGIASSGAVVMPDNPSVASFEFYAAADTVQYHVVYPYVEGAVGSRPYYSVVSFAAEQYYTEGSFDPASFPLQGYIAGTKTTADDGTVTLTQPDFTQLTLYPVSMILRFEMTAEEVVTLTKLEMRSVTGKLSGLFDTNCKYAYGLAPQSTASDEMTYIFPDGLELTPGTTKVFYVSVPKGSDHTSIRVKFCTADPTVGMVAGFDAPNLKAGVVKEFKTVTFKNNLAEYEDTIFEIKDEASLLQFGVAANKGILSYSDVKVTADVTVSAEGAAAWEPVDGFKGTLDGGDHTISGLTKPMFDALYGTVSHLTLDSKVVEGGNNSVGILARSAESGANISYITTKGSVTYTQTATSRGVFCYVAGILGYTNGDVSLTHSTNLAKVTVDMVQNETEDKAMYVGGICGNLGSGEVTQPNYFEYNTNGSASDTTLGSVTVKGSYSHSSPVYIGGVVCRVANASFSMNNLTNYASVTVDVKDVSGFSNIAGVVGYISAGSEDTIESIQHEKLYNYGQVSVNIENEGAAGVRAAGVVGYADYCTLKDCENMAGADVTLTGLVSNGVVAGTVAGGANANMSGLTNRGAILTTVQAKSEYVTAGGCMGRCNVDCNLTGCHNYGTVTIAEGATASRLLAAGGVAYQAGGEISDINNYSTGTILCEGTSSNYMGVGGAVGYATGLGVGDLSNAGSVTSAGTCEQRLYIGGCCALSDTHLLEENTNTGAVLSTTITTDEIHIGGVVGKFYPLASFDRGVSSSTNSGTVTVKGSSGNYVYVGGVIGYYAPATKTDVENDQVTLDGLDNLTGGNILTEVDAESPIYVGGVIGQVAATPVEIKNCDNAASVTCNDPASGTASTGIVNVAGVVGHTYVKSIIDNCTNSGAISCGRTTSSQPCVAGIHARTGAAYTIKNCTNSGDITLSSAHTGWCGLAGITGGYGTSYGTVSDCSNSGDLFYTGKITGNKVTYIGGVIALAIQSQALSNLTNTGVITYTGDGRKGNTTNNSVDIGGIAGRVTNVTFTGNMTNGERLKDGSFSTNIKMAGKFTKTNLGGIAGYVTAGKVEPTKIGAYGKVLVESAAAGTTLNAGSVLGLAASSVAVTTNVDNRAGEPVNESTQITTVNLDEQYNQ